MMILPGSFFDQDACTLAKQLLGKVIRKRYRSYWLSAQIIETEAYYMEEKGSHASLGFTEKRRALFMSPGTIYMYYARGSDSLNISCRGKGNAVLIKSAFPFEDQLTHSDAIKIMQQLNPLPTGRIRPVAKLCNGQTLLCRSMGLKVTDWDQQQFDPACFYLEDVKMQPEQIIQTTRLGIPPGRDETLPYRFIDADFASYCTSNPQTKRKTVAWSIINQKTHKPD
ncbi:MAG: DNA-3-methyladenine glycosylase [Gammaproteobacteria bacterium]|nr:DNA-3-methyladenine glycosylase [Gammaproteobacteria bacterium]